MATTNSARGRILDRIRKAEVPLDSAIDAVNVTMEQIYPPIGDPLQRFLAECEGNLTEVKVTGDRSSSVEALRELLAAVPVPQCGPK